MLQRLQTLFILLSGLLCTSLLFLNMATTGEVEIRYTDHWPFLILLVSSLLLNFFSLSLYKNRMTQLRATTFTTLIYLGLQIWFLVYYFQHKDALAFNLSLVVPAVCIILLLQAIRLIARDEATVRSYEHLRDSRNRRRRRK